MYEDFDFPGATIFTSRLVAYSDFTGDMLSFVPPAEHLDKLNLSMNDFEQRFYPAFVVPEEYIQKVFLLKALGEIPEFRMQ